MTGYKRETYYYFFFKKGKLDILADVVRWIEHQPANWSGHRPGLQARSPVWGMEKQPCTDVSLTPRCFSFSLSPSLLLSLKIK